MAYVTKYATEFLLAGTVYSDIPYAKVAEVRSRNRRLGLGLMGLHEWLLKKGLPYGPSDELATYLDVYETSTDIANVAADALGISRPIKTRAIAPTGSIAIVAETTGGLEPLFCVAYKRRYLKGGEWVYQYVLDPTAKRLIDAGVNPASIEDAYTLAQTPERRVAFQVWLQRWVDHGISSTLNLPAWGTEYNNESLVKGFGDMLMKYLPKLRGFTCYPDGCRSGQPFSVVSYKTAMKHKDEIFMEQMDICSLTGGGSCGS
jgi:ribonucleoside-diphosphate reductase alpha chain